MSVTRRRLLYGVGSFGSSLLQQTVLLWIFFYYAPPAGQGLPTRVPASLMGLAMAIGRLVDAIADPPVAYLSDRLRSVRGRRRPFIIVGAPLLALAFALLWRPPDAADAATEAAARRLRDARAGGRDTSEAPGQLQIILSCGDGLPFGPDDCRLSRM